MNRYLFIAFLSFYSLVAFSQPKGAHLQKINDNRLTRILSMLDTTITKSTNDMSISLYKIHNDAGSAHIEGDDEISETFLVSMGDDKGSENPDDHLFSLGEFYMPKLLEFKQVGNDRFSIIIKHWNKYWKQNKFLVTRNNVVMLK